MGKETVKKIGQLARIKIEEHESEKYANDITAVLNWFEMLDEVDVCDALCPPAPAGEPAGAALAGVVMEESENASDGWAMDDPVMHT